MTRRRLPAAHTEVPARRQHMAVPAHLVQRDTLAEAGNIGVAVSLHSRPPSIGLVGSWRRCRSALLSSQSLSNVSSRRTDTWSRIAAQDTTWDVPPYTVGRRGSYPEETTAARATDLGRAFAKRCGRLGAVDAGKPSEHQRVNNTLHVVLGLHNTRGVRTQGSAHRYADRAIVPV